MSISGTGFSLNPVPAVSPAKGALGADAAAKVQSSAAEQFLEYARMSPAERIRAAILEEMGITEEELEAMPAEQREAMEKQIAERIKEKVEQASEKKTGQIVDVTA